MPVVCALPACFAECCMYTCDIACAMPPASSASFAEAVTVPMLNHLGPHGNAKALISYCATTWNSKGQEYCDGMVATNLLPSCRTYCVSGLLSGKTGICS